MNFGNGTYPKQYTYDPVYSEMTGLKTREASGASELTTWKHQATTGLLSRQQDAGNKGTNSTYEATTSRLSTITQAGHKASYGYRANTNWEASVTHNDGSTDLFTKRTHRDLAGRITGVTARSGAAVGGALLTSAGYTLDAKGRRKSLTREDGTAWDFAYNSRDEVTAGAQKETPTGNPLAGRQFSYEYDDIGNRQVAKYGGDQNGAGLRSITYQPNAVNQYSQITHPGTVPVVGTSPHSGTITATPNQQGSTVVQGDFWQADVNVNNANTGVWADVEVEQDISGTITTIGQGDLWVPPATVSPTYDDDGNLKSDGRWNYTWNGENRLIKMITSADAVTGGHPWMQLTFEYDHIGRRIRKTVEMGSPGTPQVDVDLLFFYDGWNLLAEIDKTASAPNTLSTYM